MATSSFRVKQERREEKEQREKLKIVEEQRVKGGGREVGTFHRVVSLSAEQSKAAAWGPSSPEHPFQRYPGNLCFHKFCSIFFFTTSNKIPFLLQWLQAIINTSPAISAPNVGRVLVPNLIRKAEVAASSATKFSMCFPFDHIIGIRKVTPTEISTCI